MSLLKHNGHIDRKNIKHEEYLLSTFNIAFQAFIQHHLPTRMASADDGELLFTDDEKLKLYQEMCCEARKRVHASVDESLVELMRAPYIDVVDLMVAYQAGQHAPVFQDRVEFNCSVSQPERQRFSRAAAQHELLVLLVPSVQD